MPLGVPLSELRRELRAETGTSLNPNQGTAAQATLDLILARQQHELWDAYNWQHLRIGVDLPVAQGQGLYSFPPEMAFEQILEIFIATSPDAQWKRLGYGIKPWEIRQTGPYWGTPTRWRNVISVDTTGATPITDPIGKFEIVPVPASDTMALRLSGLAPLNPLIADTDKCMIDSRAIVLFAASEILAVQKSEGAPMKLTKAQNYLRRILQDQGGDKRRNYNMGGRFRGGADPDRGYRAAYLDYIPS